MPLQAYEMRTTIRVRYVPITLLCRRRSHSYYTFILLYLVILFDKIQSRGLQNAIIPKIFVGKVYDVSRYVMRIVMVLTCTPAVLPGRSIRPGDCTGLGRKSRKSGRCAERFRSTGPCNRPGTRTGKCRTRSCTCPTDDSRSVPDCCTRQDLYTNRIHQYNTVHS